MNQTGNKGNQIVILVVGVLIYGVVTTLPIIGGLITFFATIISLGALVLAKRDTYLLARDKKVI
jgi:hypothetical protein